MRDTRLMSLKHATSLSLARKVLVLKEYNLFNIWFKHDNVMEFVLGEYDFAWVLNVVRYLGEAPTVRTLKLAIRFPILAWSRDLGNSPTYGRQPFEVKLRLPNAYRTLIAACGSLQKLEVELLHYEYGVCREILDAELLAGVQQDVAMLLGRDFSETVTASVSQVYGGVYNGQYITNKQLLDQSLVYTRKPTQRKV
jgi:hypothetical protein